MVTEKCVLIENFIRDTLLDKATLFFNHCTSVSVESDSVHIFQSEESYVKLFVA